MSAQNTLCWVDIPVVDLARAARFYSAVLAAQIELQRHENMEFGLLPHAHDQVSGCLTPSGESSPSLTGPLIYLSVEGRLAAAVELARTSGGAILAEPHPIGPYGFRAVIRDSEGNRIALHSQAQ